MPQAPRSQLEAARALCDEAIRTCGLLAAPHVERMILRHELGDHEGSRRDARTALALGPTDLWSFLVVSFRLPDSERPGALRQGLRKLRASRGDSLYLMSELAQRDWYAGDFAACVRRYRKMLRRRTQWRYWRGAQRDFLDLGSALEALGRYRDAERAYRRAARAPWALQGLATQSIVLCRLRSGDLDGAHSALDELAGRLPRDMVTLTRAAMLAFERKPTRCRHRVLDRAVSLGVHGTVGVWGFYAAFVMLAMGDAERAIPLLERFVAEVSGNPREWGVTCRVELAMAQDILARIPARGTTALSATPPPAPGTTPRAASSP